MSTIAQTLAGHVAADTLPDFEYLTRLATPGLRERVLRESGMAELHSELFRWSLPLPSFDAGWQTASGPVPFATAFAAIENADINRVRSDLADAVSPYQTNGYGQRLASGFDLNSVARSHQRGVGRFP